MAEGSGSQEQEIKKRSIFTKATDFWRGLSGKSTNQAVPHAEYYGNKIGEKIYSGAGKVAMGVTAVGLGAAVVAANGGVAETAQNVANTASTVTSNIGNYNERLGTR